MDLFGSGPQSTPSSAPAQQSSADLLGGLSSLGPSMPQTQAPGPSAPAAPTSIPCYDSKGLNITLQTQRNTEGTIQALARFRNTGSVPLSNVGLQAAVPKTQKLQLLSISSSDLAPGAEATQQMRVSGCKGVSTNAPVSHVALLTSSL
jgi:AP-1 complex subunit gamma-1